MRSRSALLAVLALAGCGGSGADRASSGSPEREIRRVFAGYNQDLLNARYGAACERLAPETKRKLAENLRGRLGSAPAGCAAQLRAIYERIPPAVSERLRQVERSARIDRVRVQGDAATIDWSARARGRRLSITQTARRVGGAWKLVDVSN